MIPPSQVRSAFLNPELRDAHHIALRGFKADSIGMLYTHVDSRVRDAESPLRTRRAFVSSS